MLCLVELNPYNQQLLCRSAIVGCLHEDNDLKMSLLVSNKTILEKGNRYASLASRRPYGS